MGVEPDEGLVFPRAVRFGGVALTGVMSFKASFGVGGFAYVELIGGF